MVDRVVDQVGDHLVDPLGISVHERLAAYDDLDAMFGAGDLGLLDNCVEHVAHCEHLAVELVAGAPGD